MERDLCFVDTAKEARFREQRWSGATAVSRALSGMTALAWSVVLARQLSRDPLTAAAALLLVGLLASLLPLASTETMRARYAAGVATTIVQCVMGLATFDALYAPTATTTGALALTSLAYGGVWMVCYTCFSGALFRLLFLQLDAVAMLLLASTDKVCSNSNLLTTYGVLHGLLPRAATGSAAAPTPRSLCLAYQPPALLATFALVGWHLYSAELAQRWAFLARLRTQAGGSPAAALRCAALRGLRCRGPCCATSAGLEALPCSLEYWLSFALLAVCCMYSLAAVPAQLSGR